MLTPEDIDKMSAEDVLLWNLIRADAHTQQALNLIYGNRLRRNYFYRVRLLGAQTRLIRLVVLEMKRRKEPPTFETFHP
jgi:hypothetical protein